MLKYLLSTLCIFLFFEDVRLNHYKCASPDCSVLISKAKAKIRYSPKSVREVNVERGESVDIYGINVEEKNYLVKVKTLDGFHLLPTRHLTEEVNIMQKAIHEVKDPFQQNQLPRVKPPTSQTGERFRLNVFYMSGPYDGKTSLDPVDQSRNVERIEKVKPHPDAAVPENERTPAINPELSGEETATAGETEILENNTIPKDNKPNSSNSEVNTHNGKEDDSSKSTQFDLKADDHNQTNINKKEESDITIEEFDEDSIEQKNKLEVTETGLGTEHNSSDFSSSDNNSSKVPSPKSISDQPNIEPKVSHGDNPNIVSTDSLNNFTYNKNRTSGVRNKLSKMNPVSDASLNEANVSASQSNPSRLPPYAIISKTVRKHETVDSKPENLVPEQSDTLAMETKAAKLKQLSESGSPDPSTNLRNETKYLPLPPINGSASVSEEKSEPSNKDASLNFDAADSAKQKKENLDMSTLNPKNQDKPSDLTSPPLKNQNQSIPPPPIDDSRSVSEEKSEPSNNDASLNSDTGDLAEQKKETPEMSKLKPEHQDKPNDSISPPSPPLENQNQFVTVPPTNGSESSQITDPEKKSGVSNKNGSASNPELTEKKKEEVETSNSNPKNQDKIQFPPSPVKNDETSSHEVIPELDSDSPNFTDKPRKLDDLKTVNSALVGESGSPDKSVPSDSNQSGDQKPAQKIVLPTAPPDTHTSHSSNNLPSSGDHKPPASNVGKREPPIENGLSKSDKADVVKSFQAPTGKPKPSHENEPSASESPIPISEPAVMKETIIPEGPIAGPFKVEDKLESEPMKNQIDTSVKLSDSTQEKGEELVPSSQFLDTSPKNTNDLTGDQVHDGSEESNQSLENVILREESAFYSDIFAYMGNFSSLFETMAVLQSYFNFEWLQKQNDSVEQPHCDEESCTAFSIFDSMAKYGFDVNALNLPSWSLAELHQSKQTSFVAGILLCTVLLFTTLISILRNSKKKTRINTLISVINRLEKKLLVATKEISLLEEQLTDEPVTLISQPVTEIDYESSELLQQQIELLQVQNTDLEDKVTYLEKELHNVTTSAFEMHKLLENSLSTQAQSRLAEDEVDTLRTLTERQDHQIDDLMKEMDAIVTENRYLKEDLKKMEKEFSTQTKKNLELSEKNRSLSLRLDQQFEEAATMKSNYKAEIYQLQAKIEDLEINLRRSEFQVESLNRAFMDKHENRSDDQMQALQDDVQLKLQLATLKAMNNELSAELKEQKNARRTLDDHIGDVIRKCNELTQALEISEKGRSEAVNKLQVLTDYFNEKESQLQKEIAAKEKLFSESENKDQLLSQKLSSLKEEIKNNKDRNEELKKEIEAQERSFKTQLATAEQKSRDLWFALRQAERKYQESEKEAATLRNKILILENNLSSANQKLNEKHSTNGDLNGQPLMFSPEMMSFRGPNDFIPPPPSPLASHSPEFFPPEPSYSPDERLPPLGGRRVPSPPSFIVPPPEDDDFKPPLPHAQFMSGRSRHDSLNMSYYGDNVQHN